MALPDTSVQTQAEFQLPFIAATDPARISYMRPVTPDDAAFILSLSTDDDLARYLSSTSPSVQDQRNWLVRYQERERAGSEYYCIIMHKGERAGTVRLYDFIASTDTPRDSFCWGSWILTPPRPKGLVTYSAMMVYALGFDVLGFRQSHFDVRKGNQKVIDFHLRNGATQTHEDAENFYFTFPRSAYEAMKVTHAEQVAEHSALLPE